MLAIPKLTYHLIQAFARCEASVSAVDDSSDSGVEGQGDVEPTAM